MLDELAAATLGERGKMMNDTMGSRASKTMIITSLLFMTSFSWRKNVRRVCWAARSSFRDCVCYTGKINAAETTKLWSSSFRFFSNCSVFI